MIRIQLSQTIHDELQLMRRQDLPAKVRDRLEMVLLADAGWTAARIAEHLGSGYRTALDVLNDFRDRGREALVPRRRGPAPDAARREHVSGRLHELLSQDRTWTSAARRGPARPRHRSEPATGPPLPPPDALATRRTAGTVKHKQDPEKAARAAAVLANLIARAETGRLDLIYLDECGFAPSLPTGYSWCLPGQRKRVKYEYPQGAGSTSWRRTGRSERHRGCTPRPSSGR